MKNITENSKVTYKQQDGFVVEMDYRVEYNIDGDVIGMETMPIDVELEFGDIVPVKIVDKKVKFKTKKTDPAADIRKSFVNYVQGTDAQLARYIVTGMAERDCEVIVGVHDCFRGSINDVIEGRLQNSIGGAYKKMYATKDSVDVLENFTTAIHNINDSMPVCKQNDANGYRKVKMIKGKSIISMIDECSYGTEENTPYFFAK
jgi:hypothetical protein